MATHPCPCPRASQRWLCGVSAWLVPSVPHLGCHSLNVGRDNAFKGVGVLFPGVDDGFRLLLPEELISCDNICRDRSWCPGWQVLFVAGYPFQALPVSWVPHNLIFTWSIHTVVKWNLIFSIRWGRSLRDQGHACSLCWTMQQGFSGHHTLAFQLWVLLDKVAQAMESLSSIVQS